MNDQDIIKSRIEVLRLKISSTEKILNNYKDIHPFLYETNCYYLDRVRTELQELEKAYQGLSNKNRRKFSRIKIHGVVFLDFCPTQYYGILDNVSLCGLFVNGPPKQSKGDICRIIIKKSNGYPEVDICAVGSIARGNNSGIALEFIAMKPASYRCLKMTLITHATDPVNLRDEIARRNFFHFTNDLVCSSSFVSKRNKINKIINLFE